jgi:hypothetical protein
MAWDGVVSDVVCEVAWCERELCRRSAALQLFGEVVSQSSAMFMHTLRCLRGYIAELEAVAQVAAPSRLQVRALIAYLWVVAAAALVGALPCHPIVLC